MTRTILFWIDFETTGLDMRYGHGEILEYAVVLTDLELNERASVEGVIPHNLEWIDDMMGDKAREMHTKNGLLKELKAAEKCAKHIGVFAVKELEQMLIALLNASLVEDQNTIFVVAGSSIWFDKDIIREHMPQLNKLLHYRQLDVSVYKVGFPQIFGTESSPAHRAMADIRESIKKHKLMRDILSQAGLTHQIKNS